MSRLLRGLSGQQVKGALVRAGFDVTLQRGSHIVLYRTEPKARVVVPDHKEIRIGTPQQILQDAGMSVDLLRLL